MVALAYTTFGLTCVQLVVFSGFLIYTLLFLDQEVSIGFVNLCLSQVADFRRSTNAGSYRTNQ